MSAIQILNDLMESIDTILHQNPYDQVITVPGDSPFMGNLLTMNVSMGHWNTPAWQVFLANIKVYLISS